MMQRYAHEWVHAETFVEARTVGEERRQQRLKEHTKYHLIVAVNTDTQTHRYHLIVAVHRDTQAHRYHLIVATDTQQRELSTISPSCGENERHQRQKTSYYQQHQTRVRLNNYST